MVCQLTPVQEARMYEILRGIADDPHALEMQQFIQHGTVTTYEHCLRVTRIAYWLNLHWHCHADEVSLVRGAFLHDFYLYDWHNCSNITHWHGFKHPPNCTLQRRCGVSAQQQGAQYHPDPHVAADHHPTAPLPRGLPCLPGGQDVFQLGDVDGAPRQAGSQPRRPQLNMPHRPRRTKTVGPFCITTQIYRKTIKNTCKTIIHMLYCSHTENREETRP